MLNDEKPEIDPGSLLRRYQTLMVTIGTLYPLWRLTSYYYNPESGESWEQRAAIGFIFLTISLLTLKFDYFRRRVRAYFNIVGFVWLIQTMYLMSLNPGNSEYEFMSAVVIFTIGGSFLDQEVMLWFYLTAITLTGVYVVRHPDMNEFNFLWGVILALSASYIGIHSLLSLFNDLARSKKELQKRTDEFLALSAAVQTLFLPSQSDLKRDRWELSGFYRPVDSCGGDWWSYFESENKLTVLIGDITGHGPGPAMMTASIASYTRALQSERTDLTTTDILRALNKYLIELQSERNNHHNYLMTVQALELDFAQNKITSVSSGAPPVSILATDGTVRSIGSRGNPLGLEPELKLGFDSGTLVAGERILMYSDGLLEVKVRNKVYSEKKLLRIANGDRALKPDQAAKRIIAHLDDFRGAIQQQDDYTLVVVDVA